MAASHSATTTLHSCFFLRHRQLLGHQGPGMAGLCGEGRVLTATGALLPRPCMFSSGSSLAEPSSFPWASVLPVRWVSLAERCPRHLGLFPCQTRCLAAPAWP